MTSYVTMPEIASRCSVPELSRARFGSRPIAAMQELGIDNSGHRSKSVDEFTGQQFDYVMTVCDNAKESCPIVSSKAVTIHHNFEDPTAVQGSEGEQFAVFRRVRDEIRITCESSWIKSAPEAALEVGSEENSNHITSF